MVNFSRTTLCSLRAAIAAFAVLAGADSAWGIGLMVNEYRTGTSGTVTNQMGSDDFIEFVLTTNATSSELAALTFGDTNHQTSQLNSVFRFDQATLDSVLTASGQTSFLAGTFFVVKGASLGPQNLSYDPQATNASDTDAWSIELVAGQGAVDHSETVINGPLNSDRRGDVMWVSADNPPANNLDTSSFISAIGHDNNPGAIADAVIAQFGAGSILTDSFPSVRTIQNTGNGTVSLVATTTSTLGAPNSAANATWVEGSLRLSAVPEPGRASLCLLAASWVLMRRRRSLAAKTQNL